MCDVVIRPCGSYQDAKVALLQVLAPLGGLDWVQPGMRIAIKANLVSMMKPERAATTHPDLLCALTELLKERGAEVVLGDSPGGLYNLAYVNRVYAATGMHRVEAAGAVLNRDFSQAEASFPEAVSAKTFAYTRYLDDCDAIINFCKLKSHGMMGLSAATKNLFGSVPGTTKPEYHFRYPDPMDFSGMILDLNRYFRPKLFLVDGILGMEGNGPTAGTPKFMGRLLAGTDCSKVDMICCKLIGLDPKTVPTLQVAVDHGYLQADGADIDLAGDLEALKIKDFDNVLQMKSTQFSNKLPGKLGELFSKVASACLRPKPKLKTAECVGCGVCKNVCPAKAIVIENKKAVIDRKAWIRCFCCQEFCPKGAMKVSRPVIARILNP